MLLPIIAFRVIGHCVASVARELKARILDPSGVRGLELPASGGEGTLRLPPPLPRLCPTGNRRVLMGEPFF
ncbi:Hypothetical predicted protein [Podarcis lilfordi]|uniref:Uncharacterized protein n=1 Tax=Podarcis lilfordi TaxID=74358 RepID=A0AA35NT52_9SAUR|nr:Hypothetical predicted protein [Podarcis lilfordi]